MAPLFDDHVVDLKVSKAEFWGTSELNDAHTLYRLNEVMEKNRYRLLLGYWLMGNLRERSSAHNLKKNKTQTNCKGHF